MCRSNQFHIPLFLMALLMTATVQAQGPYGQMPNGHGSYQPAQINRYIGESTPDIWDESQPIERFFAAVAKRARVKLEYLHWDLENPDPRSLGAPILDIADPTTPFAVFNNSTGALTSAGLGIVVNTRELGLEDTPGARGTLAVDLNGGTLESTFFGVSQNNHDFVLDNLQTGRLAGSLGIGTALRPNVVTPLLTNGVATTSGALNAAIYDNSFRASIENQMWGAEVIFLRERYLPNEIFNWQWLGGVRYVSLEETVTQVGVFDNGGALTGTNVITTTIQGETFNNMYGPQVGGRASWRTKHISMSVTPRIAFALNDHTSRANGLVTGAVAAAGAVSSTDESIDFTPIVEVNFQLEFHLTPHCTVFGGYDLFFAGQVSRPTDNLVYDSTAGVAGFSPTLRQNVILDDFLAHGLNLGAILTY